MANTVNDFFSQSAPLWTGTLGSGGMNDASVTTAPLDSASGLVNGEVYYYTVDRVNVQGVKTPTKKEVCKGLLSGTNFIDSLRGVEGTAQQHNAGAVVEILFTAAQWNDMNTGLKVGHNADGTHGSSFVTLTGTQTLTNKTLTSPVINTGVSGTAGVVTATSTQTLTNKRITKRILSATSYTTNTGTSLNCDNLDIFIVTAQSGALKLNNPTGTPVDGQMLYIAISSDPAIGLTYDTQFERSTVNLPDTTVAAARLNMLFVWAAVSSKWIILASS